MREKRVHRQDLHLGEKDILNPDEVSRWLRIPKTTLYKLCKEGEIPSAKVGKHWRFDRLLVEEWFRERTRKNFVSRKNVKGGSVN